jgi:hypothetical protein
MADIKRIRKLQLLTQHCNSTDHQSDKNAGRTDDRPDNTSDHSTDKTAGSSQLQGCNAVNVQAIALTWSDRKACPGC